MPYHPIRENAQKHIINLCKLPFVQYVQQKWHFSSGGSSGKKGIYPQKNAKTTKENQTQNIRLHIPQNRTINRKPKIVVDKPRITV